MTKKEKEIQNALGTIKSQMIVSARWDDYDRVYDELRKALKNFGLFLYQNCHPLDDVGQEGFMISNEKLTDDQVEQVCRLWHGEDKDK